MTADTRVEPLARAMCSAAGNDPNVKVFPAIGYACERIQGRADYQKLPPDYVVVPAWELWVGDAEAALAHLASLEELKQAVLDKAFDQRHANVTDHRALTGRGWMG